MLIIMKAAILFWVYIIHSVSSIPPHIVMIVADDLGWDDVGYRNPAMPTPTLNRLAAEGVILNQSYVQPSCSPSRAALMSGRYPYHLGLQHETITSGHVQFLPNDQPILPEVLQNLGYATHMVGKWHLGFCNWRYTPTYRGFHSFYGYYNAIEDYYTHIGHRDGYDFRDNVEVDWSARGQYSTFLFANRADRIIRTHNGSHPLFLYLAFQAVHGPLQVPQSYIDKYCTHFHQGDRKIKCGMIAAMDEAVAKVRLALEETGLMKNTFLVFTSDNGGPVTMASSNWPLRGSKTTIWEGGTRAAAFVHSPNILKKTGYTHDELIHIVDWFPTFVEAAGGHIPTNIDGVSQWQSLIQGNRGPRHEFIYNIDEVKGNAAIRSGRFKLVQGHPGNPSGWYPPSELVSLTTDEPPRDKSEYQLYNLQRDPAERKNILDSHHDVFQQLKARLDQHRSSLVTSHSASLLEESLPRHFNGAWSPGWC